MKKCLIVDDETLSGDLLAHMLRDHFECKTATSGKEAWKIIESNWHQGDSFDLICCDLEMPQLSGHGLIRKIRALEETACRPGASATKIFVVTAGTSAWESGETLLDEAADGYIIKPCEPRQLLEMLQEHSLLEQS
ncbi:response regulator [Geomesophilobacter sediminis]|uniref:Response regulator n=1 Tax=Geomesophilobacter sediminis TaxID=2798584 RepID=A0A8J7SAH6_9BACT|nr:response regulator [Geomesophilobacter sediminis]MBJ6727341.1 response regulator [Geomesophilobacter sediminis]